MSNSPDVIEHIGYEFDNKSNFDIRKRELDHIVDIPVFPPQNLILDTQTVNIYEYPTGAPIFCFDDIIYALLSPHKDQRFVFLKYDTLSRTLEYRFGGRIYPQSRPGVALAQTTNAIYTFGGYVGDRDDMRDLWKFDTGENTWYIESVPGSDPSIDTYPSERRNAHLAVDEGGFNKFIFGGEVYIEIGNELITLNDLWWEDNGTWKLLDPTAELPHTPGLVVAHDAATVTVLADGQVWTVYKDGTTQTTSSPYTGSNVPNTSDVVTVISGDEFYFVNYVSGGLLKWDDATKELVVVVQQARGVQVHPTNYNVDKYVLYHNDKVKRGAGSSYQPEVRIAVLEMYNTADQSLYKTFDINAVPVGQYMSTTDLPNGRKYLGLGLNETTFIEDHFIWDGSTNNTTKIDIIGPKPNERMLGGCCYDEKRNRVWLFGGYTGSLYYNDLWYLSLDDYTWHEVRSRTSILSDSGGNKNWIEPRARAGMCVVEDTLWIVSGYSDTMSFSDMWKYDIPSDTIEEEHLTDWVNFGTDYFLFTWRDRMWLFNGEYKLYRYFFEHKQFATVTIYSTRYPEIDQLIRDRAYITPPIRIAVQGNDLIISYLHNDNAATNWISFFVDLDSKEVIQYPGSISTATFWRDRVAGSDEAGYLYFYNVSTFDFAQRNQFPYYEYSVDEPETTQALATSSTVFSYWDADAVGGGVERPCYIDKNNLYVIYTDQVEYSPLFPTFGEMNNGLMAVFWPQLDFAVADGTNGAEQYASKQMYGEGRFRSVPRFVWKRVPAGYSNKLRQAALSWFDQKSNRTYIVNNKSGNILRFRSNDGTFFNYPFSVWPESSIGHRGNFVFAFGGTNENTNTPPGYDQFGGIISFNDEQWGIVGTNKSKKPKLLAHNGIMLYDLNYMAFQMRMLAEHPDSITKRDYDSIRDYLLGIMNSQLGVYGLGEMTSDEWMKKIVDTVYSDTISIVGDLSVRNIVNEGGTRPPGPRVGQNIAQLDRDIYIGGGAVKYDHIISPELPRELVYVPYTGVWSEEDEAYVQYNYNDFYKFDTDSRRWKRLADMPETLYGSSMIASPDNTKIYLVGGFNTDRLRTTSDHIYVYDIATDTWSDLNPLPRGYRGRAKPSLYWLDDFRLLIMFGFGGLHILPDKYILTPEASCWMLNIQTNTMYKLFECMSKTSSVLESLTGRDGMLHLADYSQLYMNSFWNVFGLDQSAAQFMADDNAEVMATSDQQAIFNDDTFPLEYIASPKNVIKWSVIDPVDARVENLANIFVPDNVAANLSPTDIIKDFVDPRGDLWFVINIKRPQDTPSDPVVYDMYLYRAAKNNNWNYYLDQLLVDLPVEGGVSMVGYDGRRYLYCIWNEFNIWCLDLETAIFNPDAEYWRRMPPYPDLGEIVDFDPEMSDPHDPIKSRHLDTDEILFFDSRGMVLRFNPYSYVWYIDRYPNDTKNSQQSATLTEYVTVKDGAELYYYEPGSQHGTFYHLDYRQEDKFYFDAELLEPIDEFECPVFDAIIKEMEELESMTPSDSGSTDDTTMPIAGPASELGEKWELMKKYIAKRRSTVIHNRVLAFNKNNHLLRAWTRKQGTLDIYLEFDSYYETTNIDLSVDYDTMIEQPDRYKFTCWTNTGILEGTGTPVQEDTGYDWDPFARTYRKLVPLPNNPSEYTYIESERPGYYVRFPVNTSVRRLHIEFEPKAQVWNYISRLNHVYVRHTSDSLNFVDDNGPIVVLSIEPFDTVESDIYTVRIKNEHPTDPGRNIQVQLVNNYRVMLSVDNVNWKRATIDNPLDVADVLNPGQVSTFYLKALSYFDKSNLDMVVRGDFPPA